MINHIGKIMKKSGDAVMSLANSSIVRGISHVGTGALKLGVEGVAGVANKTIKGVQKAAPKLKQISGEKISNGIGKVVNKTMVGVGDDYKTVGKIINNSIPGEAISNKIGRNVVNDNATLRLKGSLNPWSKKPKTTYVASNDTLGLVDAVTDRAKLYIDGATDIAFGRDIKIGSKTFSTGLLKKSDDNFLGIKTTGLGTGVFLAGSAISGTPQAVETFNRNRQGTNFDTQPVSMAPSVPAYSNNGGATGDLVFALNNLRHGGMM